MEDRGIWAALAYALGVVIHLDLESLDSFLTRQAASDIRAHNGKVPEAQTQTWIAFDDLPLFLTRLNCPPPHNPLKEELASAPLELTPLPLEDGFHVVEQFQLVLEFL